MLGLLLTSLLGASPCLALRAGMEVVSVKPSHPLEGGLAKVRARISNWSDGLLALHPGKPRYGSLANHGDVVALNAMTQAATAPVFYTASAILLPGQSREETLEADALDGKVSVEREVEFIDTGASVYASVGQAGAETSFSRLEPGELAKRIAAARGGKGKDADLVVMGNGRRQFLTAAKAVKTWPRDFAFAAATRDFPGAPKAARWSDALGGWVLDYGDAVQLVRRKGSAQSATALAPGCFELLRQGEKTNDALRLHLAKPEATALTGKYRQVPGDGMYTRGVFIEVPAGRLVEALEAARAEKLAVARTNYFLEEYYYELRPAGR